MRNAAQAGAADGAEITLAVEVRGDQRALMVRDTGPGIETDVIAQVLDPFFTTREKGSGLGLALSQRILRQHEGELTIDSVVGEGTTVTFSWPFDEQAPAEDTGIPEGWLG